MLEGFFVAWMITCHRNRFLIWWIKYLHLAYPDPKFMGDVKAGCIKGKRHLFFKAPLTEAITPNGVFGSPERDGLLKKKRKSPKCIHSQRRSTFDFSFNSLTYTLCATANISQADRRKQRRPLRKPAVRTLKNSKEERKGDRERELRERGIIYLRENAGSSKAAMEKYWYFMHGNTTTHLEKHRRCKNKAEREAQGVTWNRWNSERRKEDPCGISGLFSLILTRLVQSEHGWGRNWMTDYSSHTH